MNEEQCKVKGCKEKYYAAGYCREHYSKELVKNKRIMSVYFAS